MNRLLGYLLFPVDDLSCKWLSRNKGTLISDSDITATLLIPSHNN